MPKENTKSYELKTNEHMEQFMGLMVSWASKYVNRGLGEFDDMLQETFMVYLNACESFNEKLGRFSTFLYTSLKNHMLDMIEYKAKDLPTVSLDNYYEEDSFLEILESDYNYISDDTPIIKLRYEGKTMNEIAKLFGVSRRQIYYMLEEERKKI